MSKILITGATGFVGQALLNQLASQNNELVVAVRNISTKLSPEIKQVLVGDLLPDTDWDNALSNVDTVIHLAARVHIMNDTHSDPNTEFKKINTDGTLNLARQAAKTGIKRFIYLSSIKVNGEFTQQGKPFRSRDEHIPTDPYGLSKYEAEQGLKIIALETGMEIVVIRPPLVYGPNVKANFLRMMHWINKSIPLPLGAIYNQRSLVALDNLVDLISVCVEHPAAANQTFLVSDDDDLSTTELLQRMAKALGKPARLIPVPSSVISVGATMLGKSDIAQRLCGSLQVDISHTKKTLDWKPLVSVDEALQKTANAYLKQLKQKG